MGQHTLHDYLQLPRKRAPAEGSHFLRLPSSIRRQIYLAAGLGPGRFIDLNYWGEGKRSGGLDDDGYYRTEEEEEGAEEDRAPPKQTRWADHPEADPLPTGLLYVSRAVHDEAEAVLYGENRFAISQRDAGGLRALEAISPGALRELRSLAVRLAPCFCITPGCNLERWSQRRSRLEFWECPRTRHDRPLRVIARSDRAVISRWRRICARFAAHVLPERLRLYLVCHAKDPASARAVVEPLFTMPTLRGCGISLGSCRDGELRQLARATVLRLVGRTCLDAPFRFLDLPLEIRLQILGQTALTAPVELQWFAHETRLRYRSPSLPSSSSRDKDDDDDEATVDLSHFCCQELGACGLRCGCYSFPSPYFLVSRGFGAAAMKVFYSKNRFVVLPWHPSPLMPLREARSSDEGIHRWDLSNFCRFFRCLPPGLTYALAHLVLVLPPMEPTYLSEGQRGWEQWLETIDLLAKDANLPGMTLEVHMADVKFLTDEEQESRRYPNRPKERRMREAYRRILEPLTKLRGLKVLFIHIAWPVHAGSQDARVADEQMLEKMVIGPAYNASEWGKSPQSRFSQPTRITPASI